MLVLNCGRMAPIALNLTNSIISIMIIVIPPKNVGTSRMKLEDLFKMYTCRNMCVGRKPEGQDHIRSRKLTKESESL